jgi:hypothetical protein
MTQEKIPAAFDDQEPTGPEDARFVYKLTDEGRTVLLQEYDRESATSGVIILQDWR